MELLRSIIRSLIPGPIWRAAAPIYHYALARMASLRYGNPSERLAVIGVTGTNGKTTVVHLLHAMFEAAGFSVGSASSLRFKIKGVEEPNLLKMTMPGRFELQKFLKRCVEAGCRYVILEVTSEGIAQHRARFIRYQGAVLTNVTPEHIEAHGGFEAYREAKLELFRVLGRDAMAVINREDPSSELFERATRARISWYGRDGIEVGGVGMPVRVISVQVDGIELELDNTIFTSHLGGEFNVMNILAAITTGMSFGISLSAIALALKNFTGVPGRLEFVQRELFRVVVDYAHTPDALASVYETLARGNPKSLPDRQAGEIRNPKLINSSTHQLICVLGSAGGGRDKWKRPEMGRIAGEHCGHVILTSEDPDDEDPARIASEMQSGMTNDQLLMTKIVLDRRTAIGEAIRLAKPGDTVIITGMGAQAWFIDRGGKKIPWDEVKIVSEELDKNNKF